MLLRGCGGVLNPPRSAASKRAFASFFEYSSGGFVAMTALSEEQLLNRIQELKKNAEAGGVLATVAFVESLLAKALLEKMISPLSENVKEDLFDGYGPLHELAAKIDIAFALGIINQTTKTDLHALKYIRNDFAHSTSPLHFNSPALEKSCQRLRGWHKGCDGNALFDKIAFACVQAIDANTAAILEIAPALEHLANVAMPNALPAKPRGDGT